MARLGVVQRRWVKTLHNTSGDECESVYVVSNTTRRASNRKLLRRWKNLVTKTVLGWSVIESGLDDEGVIRAHLALVGRGYEEVER